MAAFLITYDLMTPGQDYSKISAAIKKQYPMHVHILESVWIVKELLLASGMQSAEDIKDALSAEIDANDKLLVVALGKDAAWKTLGDASVDHRLKSMLES